MKAIILAAGKGSRMYPLTLYCPKALLPTKDGRTIIDNLIDCIRSINQITQIIVVVNQGNQEQFKIWNKTSNVSLYVSNVVGNVIECLYDVLNSLSISEDILLLASDNLLLFELSEFIDFFDKTHGELCVMYYQEKDLSELRRTGVASIRDEYIIDMEEKPINPKNNYAIPPFYIIPNKKFNYLNIFLRRNEKVDSLGDYLSWYIKREKVRAYLMPGKRINLGDKDAYLQYLNHESND